MLPIRILSEWSPSNYHLLFASHKRLGLIADAKAADFAGELLMMPESERTWRMMARTATDTKTQPCYLVHQSAPPAPTHPIQWNTSNTIQHTKERPLNNPQKLQKHNPAQADQVLDSSLLLCPIVHESTGSIDAHLHLLLLVVMKLTTRTKTVESDKMHALD